MLLIKESVDDNFLITESTENGVKSLFIEGIYIQGNSVNRNNRKYPTQILEREVYNYNQNYIKENRALGELNHPPTAEIDLSRVSHKVVSLVQRGDDFVGKAKILSSTPMGNIAEALIKEGVKMGVSTRGAGSLKNMSGYNEVQPDYKLIAIDIVSDPSAKDAYVVGLREGKEWVWNNGILTEVQVANQAKQLSKASVRKLEETAAKIFQDFMRSL
jgi:hypothetical protein